ncbi:hypothetical protein K501DRAFT_303760 [Backusella circina FSU 941]|nr:hypothetical protein K501DRAFT_303760 [Backusella circina FSU 941]
MDTLPTEVFRKIFLHLDQKEKVECLAVCMKWESLIKRYCLFHTIRISKYERLGLLIERLKENPHHGIQMERLLIEQCHCTGTFIDLNELLLLLPNLRTFYVRSRSHVFRITKPIVVPWHRSIERLVIGDPLLIDRFLSCNAIFYRLKTLVMNGLNLDETNLFDILAKTPVLTDLRMRSWSFSTSALEKLHTMLPLLNTLTVQLNFLDSESSSSFSTLDLDTIQPAPLMKSFHIIFSNKTTRRANLDWLNYISKKYTELSEIQYREDTYVSNIRFLTTDYRNRVELELLFGFRSLFQVLGSKLHKISIMSPNLTPDVFVAMDNFNCKCSSITISTDDAFNSFRSFMQSNQIHSIRKLKFEKLDPNDIHCLSVLTSLEELSLSFIGDDWNKQAMGIADILNSCPESLNSLEISRLALNSTSSDTSRQLSLLETLRFSYCDFEKGVDLLLNQMLPRLHVLSTAYCSYYRNEIVLPTIQLSWFHVILDRSSSFEQFRFGMNYLPNLLVKTGSDKCLYVGKSNEDEWDFLAGFIRTGEFPLYHPTKPIYEFDAKCCYTACLTLKCELVEDVIVLYNEF